MAGYVEAWVLPRYPLLVWNVQVSLDNTPPLEAAQDLMGGPLAGLFRGVGAYAIYRLMQSMTKSSLLIASRYLLPTMDPRDDPDIEWKMTGRTSHFVYEHTGLDSRGQSRIRHTVVMYAMDIASSCLASVISYPFKTWYTLMIHQKDSPQLLGFETLRSFIRENGFSALYRGFGWHLGFLFISGLSATISWSCLMRIWRACMEILDARYPQNPPEHHEKELITPMSAIGIVVFVSIFGSLASYPFDVLSARSRVGMRDPWKGSLMQGSLVQWVLLPFYH